MDNTNSKKETIHGGIQGTKNTTKDLSQILEGVTPAPQTTQGGIESNSGLAANSGLTVDIGSILGNILGGTAPQPAPQQQQTSNGIDLGGIIGSILGSGNAAKAQQSQTTSPDILNTIGGLLGGLLNANAQQQPNTTPGPSIDLVEVLGGVLGMLNGKNTNNNQVQALTSGIAEIAGDDLEKEETKAMITDLIGSVLEKLEAEQESK